MPDASETKPPPGHRVHAQRVGLSLGIKLPLFIGVLIAVVLGLDIWATYRDREAEARVAARSRLSQVSAELIQTFGITEGRIRDRVATVAAHPALAAYLSAGARGRARDRNRARDALGSAGIDPQVVSTELWDTTGGVVLATGDAGSFRRPALDTALMRRAREADRPVIGRFRAVGDSEGFPVVAALRTRSAVRGYVVEWRLINASPNAQRSTEMLLGMGGRIAIGNTADSVWTNLATRVEPPPFAARGSTGVVEYRRRPGEMMALERPVPATPWSLIVEFPADSVIAPARAAIESLVVIGLLGLAVGLAGAWLLSRRLTTRLARLTRAAESLGTGGVAPTPRDAAAGDELTRLGIAYDAMAHRVDRALSARDVSEEQYRSLFESVPLPTYVVDLETLRFAAVNTAAIAHYGYSRDEFMAMSLRDIRPPEDVPRIEAEVRTLGTRPEPRGVWRHIKRDGTLIDVEVVGHEVAFRGRRAALAVVTDITDRTRAEMALKRSEERYRTLIREAPYGIALSTPEGTLIEVNPALVDILGYDSPAELTGTWARDLYVDPTERDTIVDELERLGRCRREAVHWKRRDGRLITARFSARLVPATHDADPYVEAIIEDVTERLRLTEQFHQAQRMEAIGRLAGGIAHDFNNLLTVILTTTELMLDQTAGEVTQRSELEEVHRSARRGAELTRQLLAFSRRQVLSMRPLSVNALISDLEGLMQRLLGEDVRLKATFTQDVDVVHADPTQLEQVLLNLAVNARDAMPDGGQLLIETAPVDIQSDGGDPSEAMQSGPYVRVVVSDSGEGMTPEVRAHVFEPFFTTKGRDKGTGLGLATVYGIVKQLGGYVWVYSEPGQGATFKIYLPRVDEAPLRQSSEASPTADAAGSETVLMAEDEEAIRALLTRVLEARGYTVLAESSGEEALRRAAEHAGPIDVLVTDVVMAGMTGPQLASRLADVHPETVPLFLSGYTDEAVLKFGVAAGQVAFLQKPFTHHDFLAKVRDVLDGRKADRLEP